MTHPFEFFLFATDPAFVNRAVDAGIDAIIVDWESRGKKERQKGYDTQIGVATLEDLVAVRNCTSARVICRVNGLSNETPGEIEAAIDAGTNDVLLPMVRTVKEVESALELVRDRCGVGILVETEDALSILSELGRMPLSMVYVGLNDLCIERRGRNIFTPMTDGTVERIRAHFEVPFGFAGLTLPEKGYPIPCSLLMGEMARLESNFSFLRRSFCSDMKDGDLSKGISRIREAITVAHGRTSHAVEIDRAALEHAVMSSNELGPVG